MGAARASRDADLVLRLESTHATCFDWGYGVEARSLRELYEKGKRLAWNAQTDLDWSREVDLGRTIRATAGGDPAVFNALLQPPRPLSGDEALRFTVEVDTWMLSQFLHGEQGALLAAARLVETAPGIESKQYAALQAADEARHVEVFDRYLRDKIGARYPVNPHLEGLMRELFTSPHWDVTFLGMQILLEGLALAAFNMMALLSGSEPLLQDLIRRVIADEARHVAFGVLALEDLYEGELEPRELRERESFVIDGIHLMHERLLMEEVFERLGWPRAPWRAWALETPFMLGFRRMLFSKIVPNLRRIGLLTPRVRDALERLDLLRFESAPDSTACAEVAPPSEFLALVGEMAARRDEAA